MDILAAVPGPALQKAGIAQPTELSTQRIAPSVTADGDLREAFDDFVGEAFFGQLLQAMRKTVGEPAYFHGGRAEEVFQGQLDQILAQRMTEAEAGGFTGDMFELFTLQRS